MDYPGPMANTHVIETTPNNDGIYACILCGQAVAPFAEGETCPEAQRDEAAEMAEFYADAEMAYYDDDPNPYDGTYSEC